MHDRAHKTTFVSCPDPCPAPRNQLEQCWCGNDGTDYNAYGESDSCDYPCGGDPSEFCGGFLAMSVWVDLE